MAEAPNTRENAMSRLFGSSPASEKKAASEKKTSEETPTTEAYSGEVPALKQEDSAQTGETSTMRPKRNATGTAATGAESRGGVEPSEGGQGDSATDATGYVGHGRYRQKSGEEKERITPYVRPDQARALRVAAAPGDDPRGSDISEIVRTLLDEAGLCDPAQRDSAQ